MRTREHRLNEWVVVGDEDFLLRRRSPYDWCALCFKKEEVDRQGERRKVSRNRHIGQGFGQVCVEEGCEVDVSCMGA